MFKRLRKWIRDLAGLDDTPHKIALGFALGILVGFVPLMGIQMAVVLPFALAFRGNKAAAISGVWITNPLTVIPIYYGNYIVGLWVTPYGHMTWDDFSAKFASIDTTTFLKLGADLLVPLFVGGTVLGVVLGIPTYFATKAFIIRFREKRQERKERKEQDAEDGKIEEDEDE